MQKTHRKLTMRLLHFNDSLFKCDKCLDKHI